MKRQAIIIANPGEIGASSYCEGVNKDCDAYPQYFKAPFGGSWRSAEIEVLRRPSAGEVRLVMSKLRAAEYGVVIFAGHGYVSQTRKTTMLELRKGEEIDSADLRAGAKKQTLILDCCRKIETSTTRDMIFAEAMRKSASMSADKCRHYYDEHIDKCPSGIAVLWACSIGETAGDDSARGGYYSSSLLGEAEEWAKNNAVAFSMNFEVLDVAIAHERAAVQVGRRSGGRQKANIEKSRSGPYFPFGVVA